MPLATLHLISLKPSITKAEFIKALLPLLSQPPLTISSVVRWIITPSKIQTSQLLHPTNPWSIFLVLESSQTLPSNLLSQHVSDHWTIQVGIPSRLTKSFTSTNKTLLHPTTPPSPASSSAAPKSNPNTSQNLELSPGLNEWINTFSQTHTGQNAMSMFNLLAFNKGMKASYLEYGKAFAESIGSKRGGNAKLVGNVVPGSDKTGNAEIKWDEFALAHYPSIMHFKEMLASEDYQAVNHKFRVPSLYDTCILCTSEIEMEALLGGEGNRKGAAKL